MTASTAGRVRGALVATLAATLLWAAPGLAAWNQPIGGPSPLNVASDRTAVDASLADIGGLPHVAWRETDGTVFLIRVKRLNAAGTAWEQVGGADPPNASNTRNAFDSFLASVAGVPHLVWAEYDGTNDEARVARLNAAGTAWEEIVGGPSPINQDPSRIASHTMLADIGGVPWVAWRESDGTNREIRVSRLSADGTAWEQVIGGASPINNSPTQHADEPYLAEVAGVPHVAWREEDGVNSELRVSRLNAAGSAWEQLVGGASPINQSSTQFPGPPTLADIGGVPHVAWAESDGVNTEVRVSRLNAAGTAWEQLVGGASPINHSSTGQAFLPHLMALGGAPFVTWTESDGTNREVRAALLNAAGTAWEQVVGGASPINESDARDTLYPRATAVGGVPYVAWTEEDGTNDEVRVSRLEPDFLAGSETATETTATLSAGVRTFGVALPIGFEYGPGPAFGAQTAPVTARSGNLDTATVTQTVTGLSPFTDHSWRPFGTDLTRTTGIGPTRGFRTAGTPPAPPLLASPLTTVAGDTTAPRIERATVRPTVWAVDRTGRAEAQASQRRRAPRGTTFRFTLSEQARVEFTIARRTRGRRIGGRCRPATRRTRQRPVCIRHVRVGRFAHAGRSGANRRRFSGRIGRRRLRPARHRATLVATDAAQNRSRPVRLRFRVVRR